MNVDKIIGENIRKYRTAYNMTLKELSLKLRKSISTVSKYEKGDIALDLPTFIEIAHILKVSPSFLLEETTDPAMESLTYEQEAHRFYMYSYDTQAKSLIQSIIEQYPSRNDAHVFRAQLFNDVKDLNNPGNCSSFYIGEYNQEGFIGTYILHNQMITEHVFISCIHNLVNSNQQIGLMSGLSNYTMLPITLKVLISNTEITNKDWLIQQLIFSKEDYKLMKKTNYLALQNSQRGTA